MSKMKGKLDGIFNEPSASLQILLASKTLNDAELRAEEEELEDEREERVGEDQGHGVGDLQGSFFRSCWKKVQYFEI